MASYYMFTFQKFLAPGSSLKYHYVAIACIFSATVFIVVTMPTHAVRIAILQRMLSRPLSRRICGEGFGAPDRILERSLACRHLCAPE